MREVPIGRHFFAGHVAVLWMRILRHSVAAILVSKAVHFTAIVRHFCILKGVRDIVRSRQRYRYERGAPPGGQLTSRGAVGVRKASEYIVETAILLDDDDDVIDFGDRSRLHRFCACRRTKADGER